MFDHLNIFGHSCVCPAASCLRCFFLLYFLFATNQSAEKGEVETVREEIPFALDVWMNYSPFLLFTNGTAWRWITAPPLGQQSRAVVNAFTPDLNTPGSSSPLADQSLKLLPRTAVTEGGGGVGGGSAGVGHDLCAHEHNGWILSHIKTQIFFYLLPFSISFLGCFEKSKLIFKKSNFQFSD